MGNLYEFLPKLLYQLDVSDSVSLTTYHSLLIQYLQEAPEDGPLWSETCRAYILSINKNLISATTLCISLDCIYIILLFIIIIFLQHVSVVPWDPGRVYKYINGEV